MSNYRNRPKGQYIFEANWKDLYILTERWQNDLELQCYEIEFLERLIETYFVKLLLRENIEVIRELQRDLFLAKNRVKKLLQQIEAHLSQIINLLNEPFKFDILIFRYEHEQLEDQISQFIKNQNVVRYTVFKITKDILNNEKPKFIWKYN